MLESIRTAVVLRAQIVQLGGIRILKVSTGARIVQLASIRIKLANQVVNVVGWIIIRTNLAKQVVKIALIYSLHIQKHVNQAALDYKYMIAWTWRSPT